MNSCLIRLSGEKEWDRVESWNNSTYESLIMEWLNQHPEFYSKNVMLDGYKDLEIEIKDEILEKIREYDVAIDYYFTVTEKKR